MAADLLPTGVGRLTEVIVTAQKLTSLQRRVLEVLCSSLVQHGQPPRVSEIADALGFDSLASVYPTLDALRDMGYITRHAADPQRIELHCEELQTAGESINASRSLPIYVPLLSDVAAGQPIVAEEHIEKTLPLPSEFVGSEAGGLFILRMRGDSMVGAGILDNDYILVRSQSSAEAGDIVAARLGDEVIVKKLSRVDGRLLLASVNPTHQPVEASNVFLLGKVLAVMRVL